MRKIGRLFTIKTRTEASLIIYALGLGACERGIQYMEQYPGFAGQMLFVASTGTIFVAGAKIFDCLRLESKDLN